MEPTGRNLETDLTELETALASLRPSAVALDRDRLLFEAGRASARTELRGRLGTVMAAVFALVAVGLGLLLARERGARMGLEATIASLDARAPSAPLVTRAKVEDMPSGQPGPNSYLVLTRHLMAGGIDSMPFERPAVSRAPARIEPAELPAMLRLRAIEELLEL